MRVLVALLLIIVFNFVTVAAAADFRTDAAAAATNARADAAPATAGWPDYGLSYCTEVVGGFFMTPEGSGASLHEQGVAIELWVVEISRGPLEGFPREDLWFQAVSQQDLRFCDGGNLADANTDAAGHTWFSAAPAGGGCSEGGLQVYIEGHFVDVGSPSSLDRVLELRVNSPDINGDLQVTLADITLSSRDLEWGYKFRSDFHQDGVLNLNDILVFTNALGESCL